MDNRTLYVLCLHPFSLQGPPAPQLNPLAAKLAEWNHERDARDLEETFYTLHTNSDLAKSFVFRLPSKGNAIEVWDVELNRYYGYIMVIHYKTP